MSDYSGYQRTRAHALGPFSSVYEATAPNGAPGRFALKIFHPPASSNIRRAYAIEGWLLAAERQQKAAKKDGAVLEVVAFGRCPEGAYMVMPWQDRSLEPLVDTLAARGDLLRAMAELLLNTLEQWGAQTGGSHRKLKPSNIFLTRSGLLAGGTAVLSDPWFLLGVKSESSRRHDLAAVGAILAQVVRRREVAAWPIEDAPEWRALGRAGKAWLAYVNYLMDPQPASGELTIAEARKRLRAIPKDSNPARTALIVGVTSMVLVAGGVVAFARFGNPIYMPGPIYRLAEAVNNPLTRREAPSADWAPLCRAWDTWLGDLEGNAARLLRTETLWSGPNDPLRVALQKFVAEANRLRPGVLVPEAAGEKRMAVLAEPAQGSPVYEALLLVSAQDRISVAMNGGRMQEDGAELQGVRPLSVQLERWQRWEEMRELLARIEARGFTRAAAALGPRLAPRPGTEGYRIDMARTLKLFNDLSLDSAGTLPLASRWSETMRLSAEMEGSGDRVQQAMPALITNRLVDRASLADFADSLVGPLEEIRLRLKLFNDPQVVRERFLKESVLQKETAPVTVDDFPRWEEQLGLFSKVAAGEDPRQVATLNASVERLPRTAADLEDDAPAPEPGGVATLNRAEFEGEFAQRNAELAKLRAREIVHIDLPEIVSETDALLGRFALLEQRVEATLVLLRPETWLAKVAQAYGRFNETRQRWAAWQRAAVAGVTPDSLRGPANRERFRGLRQQERQVRNWIDGLEGPEGLGALAVPDLSAFFPETAAALTLLEAARREQAARDAAAAAEWQAALPVVAWSNAGATVREPVEAHREWLSALPAFATDLDRLGALLAGGFSWTEGVGEVVARLAPRPGLDALAGPPAEAMTEARLLERLVNSTDRAELAAAAQSGGLSRKLTAWRRLGTLAGWPANAADLDIDGAVVADLRRIVSESVKDAARGSALLDELGRETRVRWNRAARNSASSEEQMTAVFERMARYNIAESDLEDPALYNLKLWQLKHSDWSEVDIAPLRKRRDDFVAGVRAISGAVAQTPVRNFIEELAGIELVVDPNRAPTPSPRMAGWTEELTDAGLGLTATWQRGGRTVKLDFTVIQPEGDLAPFYLARREIAVGEFLDLMATDSQEDATAVLEALPTWARTDSLSRPFNQPMSWRPRGDYRGLELNPTWFHFTTAQVKGLFDDTELQAQTPPLRQAVEEKPTLRSPLQQIPPGAAKLFVEKMLGARLPTVREWEAVVREFKPAATGNFRGPAFQNLFSYLRDYNVAGQKVDWRPNTGAYQVMVPPPTGTRKVPMPDDGQAAPGIDRTRLWLSPVEEGPLTANGGIVNLTGNVWFYLQGPGADQYFVAGGSAFSHPGLDVTQPQKVEPRGLIGATRVTEGFSDVGVRPAFDAPPGFKERYRLLVLVRQQGFLTW